MKNLKKPKYLGNNKDFINNPEKFILDPIKNTHLDKDYSIRFTAPEFTSICPITAQPDFGVIIIDYIPNKFLLESKSLKLFLFLSETLEPSTRIVHLKLEKKLFCISNPNG